MTRRLSARPISQSEGSKFTGKQLEGFSSTLIFTDISRQNSAHLTKPGGSLRCSVCLSSGIKYCFILKSKVISESIESIYPADGAQGFVDPPVPLTGGGVYSFSIQSFLAAVIVWNQRKWGEKSKFTHFKITLTENKPTLKLTYCFVR